MPLSGKYSYKAKLPIVNLAYINIRFNNNKIIMKTHLLKKTFPFVTIILAITSALGNYAMNDSKSNSGSVVGYIKNNIMGTDCTSSTMCTTSGGEICTINGIPGTTQLFSKNAQGRCIDEIYREHN